MATHGFYIDIANKVCDTFANQQFGKRHGFRIDVCLRSARDHSLVKNRPCSLKATLLYADNQELVPSGGDILKLLDWSDVGDDGEGFLFCRINSVSRNHGGRSFRVRVDGTGGSASARGAVKGTITSAIRVISKTSKAQGAKSRRRVADGGAPAPKRARSSGPAAQVQARAPGKFLPVGDAPDVGTIWASSAFCLLKSVEWRLCGYEQALQGGGVDKTRPIHRCASCSAMATSMAPRRHHDDCQLQHLLRSYERAAATDIELPPDSPDSLFAVNDLPRAPPAKTKSAPPAAGPSPAGSLGGTVPWSDPAARPAAGVGGGGVSEEDAWDFDSLFDHGSNGELGGLGLSTDDMASLAATLASE